MVGYKNAVITIAVLATTICQLLAKLPNADITFLVEPERRDIKDRLWEQNWQILFFAGHSVTGANSIHTLPELHEKSITNRLSLLFMLLISIAIAQLTNHMMSVKSTIICHCERSEAIATPWDYFA